MLANRRSLNFTKFHSYILNPLIDKKNYSYLKLVSTGNPSIDNANVARKSLISTWFRRVKRVRI